ncbi:hypothetical protein AAU57_08770 [Nonlabens sp. YIK11]|uniref:hypothetical protein n=1 Tax=Nonlabens sp. YIK11 TaxID=1453349 RepID=UPI0006DC66EA|nr:hypothetical protein [Nonlabens sp. YIK11]KQC33395.1 hypothetical protein AAU57_08770 [Nonlabens sp. YIK11]
MNTVTVNGKQLDLYEGEEINLTYQINNISDISTRNSTYSNTISFPKTSRNITIFENLGINGNTSNVPYRKLPCSYNSDTIPIISSGYMQVRETNKDSFDAAIFDGIINLSEKIKGKKLSDLDFGEYNHFLTETLWLDSHSNTNGYTYPFADYGGKFSGDLWQIEYQLPALFLSTLWDMIFTQNGYTYEGDLFESEDFKRKIITPNKGLDVVNIPPSNDSLISSYTSSDEGGFYQGQNRVTHYFPMPLSLTNGSTTSFRISNGNIISNYTGRIKVELTPDLLEYYGGCSTEILRNGNVVLNNRSLNTTQTAFIDVAVGDVLRVQTKAESQYYDYDPDFNDEYDEGYVYDFSNIATLSLYEVSGGRLIDFSKLYVDVDQSAFIKSIMQHYGLIVSATNGNNLKFLTMEDLLKNRANAEDWTDKVISIESENYSLNDYARNNRMRFKYEENNEELLVPQRQDGNLFIDNEHLAEEKDLFTSIFRVRNFSIYNSQGALKQIPLWKTKETNGTIQYEPIKSDLSLLRHEKPNKIFNYKLYDNGAVSSYAGLISSVSDDDCDFDYFINNYYSELTKLLNKNKKVTINAFLTDIDLMNLSFIRLKYLKQTGKYYYLNTVKSNSKGTSKIEMFELND